MNPPTPAPEEAARGRRRSRAHNAGGGAGNGNGNGNGNGHGHGNGNGASHDHAHPSPDADPNAEGTPRKRRRSRKGLDKKFECPHPRCGKSYSRAEHLYRHQLNHNPKDIYRCKFFPDCPRYFVRADLCARHEERHTARAPPPPRPDAFVRPGGTPRLPDLDALATVVGRDRPVVAIKMESAPSPAPALAPAPRPVFASDATHPLAKTEPSPTSSTSTVRARDPARTPARTDHRPTSASSTHSAASDADGHAAGRSRKRSHSDSSHRADAPRHVFERWTTPRSTPVALSDTRRPLSFGAADFPRPPFSPPTQRSPAFVRPALLSSASTPAMATHPMYASYPPLAAGAPAAMKRPPMDAAAAAAAAAMGTPASFVHPNAFVPLSLPPPGYATMTAAPPGRGPDAAYMASPPVSLASLDAAAGSSAAEAAMMDAATYAIPVFGGGGYRSPFAMGDDFTSWLFNEEQHPAHGAAAALAHGMGYQGVVNWADPTAASFASPSGYGAPELAPDGFFPPARPPAPDPMSVTSLLDSRHVESLLTEPKRSELLALIERRFQESDQAPVSKSKAELLAGDRDDDAHVLSLRMLQIYIWSYWYHFHPQLPLLHYPTFDADQTQPILLLAMIVIGASCLEKVHGDRATRAGAKLATFLAWHLRGEIFSHAHFQPPAKLWTFQALLLLELYEKLLSTRRLHERAHIHHATTVTLMRRGHSLIGQRLGETPPSGRDERSSSHGSGGLLVGVGGVAGPGRPGPPPPDRWWSEWITAEATRRAAFTAFMLDALHATMFGHSIVMVVHEIQLPLPVDETLWGATSSAELGRLENQLAARGAKRVRFLEGLKIMFGGQSVETGVFGRTILMAGLLCVSLHMIQREVQLSSLGVKHFGRDRWRGSLTRAFDRLKADFDAAIRAHPESAASSTAVGPCAGAEAHAVRDAIALESIEVLHHLAHMATHVDIVDCQILARAGRLLGRHIGPQDYLSAQRRMKEWAVTAKGRDATFYALRFLCHVLLGPRAPPPVPATLAPPPPGTATTTTAAPADYPGYAAREDYLMNRPWVVYFAGLVVWSYGYVLEGAIQPYERPPVTAAQKQQDMWDFLDRVRGLRSPDELLLVPRRNRAVGLLMVLRDTFEDTRWELLTEGSRLLGNCIDMLVGPPA
ncbi:MAG: hypothetical protein M1826_007187 [Phylliscum demangeonii]|nr:MAG: hypothetical protein M1826_007187 [Phylliscum demangeonii]